MPCPLIVYAPRVSMPHDQRSAQGHLAQLLTYSRLCSRLVYVPQPYDNAEYGLSVIVDRAQSCQPVLESSYVSLVIPHSFATPLRTTVTL